MHKNQYTFLIITHLVLLRIKNVSYKSCRENQSTHFLFNNFFFRKSYRLWDNVQKNILERGRPQMTIGRMRIECWIPKATNTHSEYVILIPFLLQLWLNERNSMLRYRNIACLRSCTVHVGSIKSFICPINAHKLL